MNSTLSGVTLFRIHRLGYEAFVRRRISHADVGGLAVLPLLLLCSR